MTAKAKKKTLPPLPTWWDLLEEAINVPGTVAACYAMFHDYSPGNQMLAKWQCMLKKIECGPMGTYKFWKDMGRQVTSGPGSALYLCRPVSWTDKEENEDGIKETHTTFKYEPRWFVLSQTQGDDYEPPPLPGWDIGNAIVNLEVEPVAFDMPDGNCMGYAFDRKFAVNPLNTHPNSTTMHELAHIVLGHTQEDGKWIDSADRTPTSIREAEAEATSYIVLDQLDEIDGHMESRGYIQHWLSGNDIPEESARRVFSAADKILKAGRA